MSLYFYSSRLGTFWARPSNVIFLSTSLSCRFLYQVVFYCLVCIVGVDLLCVVCIVFVRVKKHLHFTHLIISLKLKEFKLLYHETLEKNQSKMKFIMWDSFPNSSRVLLWTNELQAKERNPVAEVNICYIHAGLHNSQTFVKFYSKQHWKNKGDKYTRLIWWLNEKVAFLSY